MGKTTLARSLPGARQGYLNWDAEEDRERILRRQLPAADLWVFDEIHKYRAWRGFLKGLYDTRREDQRILVTGSGRLELFGFGGDSLQGRYHLLRLHPFSVAEAGIDDAVGLSELLRLGGFPEPFLGGGDIEARRWSRQYRTRLIEGDVASLTAIRDLGRLEEMMLRLPELVGAPTFGQRPAGGSPSSAQDCGLPGLTLSSGYTRFFESCRSGRRAFGR